MKGKDCVETLLDMADRRVRAIPIREAERKVPDHHLRREVSALRLALVFMNTPRDILPILPELPDHLRRKP
jgi:hypothetical protein